MGRPAAARATFIAREGWAQDRPEPPTQSPVKYPRVKDQSFVEGEGGTVRATRQTRLIERLLE